MLIFRLAADRNRVPVRSEEGCKVAPSQGATLCTLAQANCSCGHPGSYLVTWLLLAVIGEGTVGYCKAEKGSHRVITH